MTAIETAIGDAVESGSWDWRAFQKRVGLAEDSDAPVSEVLLDPSFWKSLGKARGWEKEITFYNTFTTGKENNDQWRLYWHRFIDHLSDGKDAESFFKSL